MAITVITAPEGYPVTLEQAKQHLRYDQTEEDSYIEGLIATATAMAEAFTGRALITQTLEETLDYSSFANAYVELSRMPLQTVSHLDYYDSGGALVRLYDIVGSPQIGVSDYALVNALSTAYPGRLYPAYGITWPTVQTRDASVVVRYVAGYGDDAESVPPPIRHAILMLISHLYENREPVVIGAGAVGEVPMTVQWLLSPYRIYLH